MRVFAENFNAVYEDPVAPSMTIHGYAPQQNAGGVIVVYLQKDMSVKPAAAQLSMFSSEAPRASRSPSPDSAKAWLIRVATSPSRISQFWIDTAPVGAVGRTSPASCQRTEDGRWEPFSEGWGNSGMGSHTGFLTLSTSEYPKDADVCSLSDILETGALPRRFYLSARACQGILRRAEKRGKALPPALQSALHSVGQGMIA